MRSPLRTSKDGRSFKTENSSLLPRLQASRYSLQPTRISSINRTSLAEAWRSSFCLRPVGRESSAICRLSLRQSIKHKEVATVKLAYRVLPKPSARTSRWSRHFFYLAVSADQAVVGYWILDILIRKETKPTAQVRFSALRNGGRGEKPG